MMKVLFVTQFFPSPNGIGNTGGTISNLNMLRVLSQKYDVTVLSFDSNAQAEAISDESFRVLSSPAPDWNGPLLFRHWLNFVRTETRAVIANTEPPDAVIATTSSLAAFDVCPRGTSRVALVRAYENFGLRCPWVPPRQRINLGKLAMVRRFQDPRLMRKADAVLTNSDFMRSAIASRFGIGDEHIHVLLQASNVEALETEHPPNTVGFVTRGAEKGLSFVLELARRSPDLRYLIYGHDRELPAELPANVEWRGWESDRNAMFAAAKLWLMPSLWAEPFGRVSIEAQASDRSVLVAAHGGLPETVSDDRFKIEGFEPGLWVKHIRTLLQIPPDELKRNGAMIRKKFSDDAHDARILMAMRQIFDAKKGMTHD